MSDVAANFTYPDGSHEWSGVKTEDHDFKVINGHFTSSRELQMLVLIDVDLGSSWGTHDNLMMLFNCPQNPDLIDVALVCDPEGKPMDLTGDGLDELITSDFGVHMGECNEWYHIWSWKEGKAEIIFEANSLSHVGCGGGWSSDVLEPADTLACHYRHQLSDEDGDGKFEVLQIREISIQNGGTTESEIMEQMITTTDSVVIRL
jgi:hypothetical protein